jgi:ethanolamine utilization protein EutA
MHDELEAINTADLTEIFGLESFLLKSVGITIGSSTTHLMFSRLTVRRSDSRASHFAIVEREVIHRSPVIFTPYIEGVRVDTEKLRHFFKDVYNSAGITPGPSIPAQ